MSTAIQMMRSTLHAISLNQLKLHNSEIGALLALGIAICFAVRTVYRLFFHPLSHFPGPKLAAISHLYEFYYDVIRNGIYIEKIDGMHQKYGLNHETYK